MILCCGEALIDMLPRVSTQNEPCFAPHAGGAVFNTAIALGRLNAETGLFSGIADDFLGKILLNELEQSGVDCSVVRLFKRPSTVAYVQLQDGQARYAFYDEGTAGRLLDASDIPSNIQANAFFFGGISLVSEPCGSTYETLLNRVSDQKVTMIDPNIRPSFIQDEAAYRARIERIFSRADIIKLSDEDLSWLTGQDDIPKAAQSLLHKGPVLILVTQGHHGAHAFFRDEHIFVPAQKVNVVDTVGAGDTFNAGVLAELQAKNVLEKRALHQISAQIVSDAVTLGNRAAAVTVSRAGANPPRRSEL